MISLEIAEHLFESGQIKSIYYADEGISTEKEEIIFKKMESDFFRDIYAMRIADLMMFVKFGDILLVSYD